MFQVVESVFYTPEMAFVNPVSQDSVFFDLRTSVVYAGMHEAYVFRQAVHHAREWKGCLQQYDNYKVHLSKDEKVFYSYL